MRYIDTVDLIRPQQVDPSPFWSILHVCLRFNNLIAAISKQPKLEREVSEISYDISERTYDKSVNWSETLAKRPKTVANCVVNETIPRRDDLSIFKYLPP